MLPPFLLLFVCCSGYISRGGPGHIYGMPLSPHAALPILSPICPPRNSSNGRGGPRSRASRPMPPYQVYRPGNPSVSSGPFSPLLLQPSPVGGSSFFFPPPGVMQPIDPSQIGLADPGHMPPTEKGMCCDSIHWMNFSAPLTMLVAHVCSVQQACLLTYAATQPRKAEVDLTQLLGLLSPYHGRQPKHLSGSQAAQ